MNDVLLRIKSLLEDKGISENAFAKEIGIAQSTYNTWVQKDRVPSAKWLPVIAEHLGVSIDFLMYGEEQEDDSFYINDETKRMIQDYFERPEIRMLFKATRDLPPEQVNAVTNMIKAYKGED